MGQIDGSISALLNASPTTNGGIKMSLIHSAIAIEYQLTIDI